MSREEPKVTPKQLSARHHPAHGVLISELQPTIVFLTVCTKDRERWLANAEVHQTVKDAWTDADAWRVGRFVVMPDHIHLFVSPADPSVSLENWIMFWKSQFTKNAKRSGTFTLRTHPWQTNHWDTRLRNWRSYESKWVYVRNNPVRHGLVERAEDWPYQGELHNLRWD